MKENACQDEGVEYNTSGSDFGLVKSIRTVEACADICHNSDACNYWQHTKSDSTCRTRSTYQGATFVGGDDVTSGVSPCPEPSDPCKLSNMIIFSLSSLS